MFTTNDELNGLQLTRLCSDIIGTNLLTKFHEDQKINVASRVLTRKNAPPLAAISEINVASRVKNVPAHGGHETAPPLGSHVFQAKVTIFKLIQNIIGTNFLSKFHEDRKINVASRVLTSPAPGGHVFQPTGIIFERIYDIIGINLLTKFHEDRTINVASRENCPAPCQPCFSSKVTIFKLIQDIIGPNLLSKFHESVNKEICPAPGGHVFQPTGIIFKLVQDIIWMNLLTKFHEDWSINMASKVTNCPAPSHPYIIDIIETNLLTKFHEDWIINVACRELTRLVFTAHDTRWTKCDHKSSP
ncbi:hypothetical protein DPMN_160819 [Dreissena polymorpha]|uniref:Uncharacterized protein n=1 Tax=Dreissena polymorpha TaxID=45954 RepID=A0A9D4ENI2_DREPO|nr:hypothetical protein DPMN_160819 [Dreissena polymorpha]